jgi:hypothetical protein
MHWGQGPVRPGPDRFGRYEIPLEVLRFDTLMDAALIVLGVYILQAFISTNVADGAGRVSIVAWALAIPLLAFLALLNRTQEAYKYASIPIYLTVARGLALSAAVVGFGAAVWHLWTPASLVLVASGLGGVVLYRGYLGRLERDNAWNEPSE